MSLRKDRQNAILEAITEAPVSTQDELMAKLSDKGFHVTQATISRDIKELKLIKKIGDGGRSVYSLNAEQGRTLANHESILGGAIVSVACAMNLCVVKTHIGMANAACVSIDNMNYDGVVGSIAGDDTIFLACTDETKAKALAEFLQKQMKF